MEYINDEKLAMMITDRISKGKKTLHQLNDEKGILSSSELVLLELANSIYYGYGQKIDITAWRLLDGDNKRFVINEILPIYLELDLSEPIFNFVD